MASTKTSKSDATITLVEDLDMDGVIKDDTQVRALEVGELIAGKIVSMGKNKILLDIMNFAVGVIAGPELQDSRNTLSEAKPGDEIEALVIGTEDSDGQYILSLKRAAQIKTWKHFNEAFETGETVEVRVMQANKGGLLIDVDGIRGFIPVSQLSPENYPRVNGADAAKIKAKLDKLVGTKLDVKILNIDRTDGRLIFSERAAQAKERSSVLSKLSVGDKVKGRVSGVVNFGIFINYEGVEGLVHISEITWGHVSNPGNFAKVGDEVDVMVIGVDGEKVSFSMKRLTPDPWVKAVSKYKVGDMVKGPVSRITPFGAFVKLEDEIDGLIHVSEMSDEHVADPSSILKLDQEVEAKVVSIDPDEHRLGLSIKVLSGSASSKPEVEEDASMEDAAEVEDKAEAKKKKKADA